MYRSYWKKGINVIIIFTLFNIQFPYWISPRNLLNSEKVTEFRRIKVNNSEMRLVKLKNGAEESLGLVKVVMMMLNSLLNEETLLGPLSFYELVMKCRDPNHEIQDPYATHLKELGLLQQDGNVHSSIRNIVLSAVTGEGLHMKLQWPVVDD